MTIYDLLGLIKNGNPPKKIIYNSKGWKLTDDKKNYITIEFEYDTPDLLFDDYLQLIPSLNDEIEVIEDNKKIEKLGYSIYGGISEVPSKQKLMDKINEIIEVLNEKD